MTLYEPGDRVVVREDLNDDGITEYHMFHNPDEWNTVVSEMYDYAGKTVTINKIIAGQYRIVEDKGFYGWVDEMFAGLESELYGGDPIEIENLESLFS